MRTHLALQLALIVATGPLAACRDPSADVEVAPHALLDTTAPPPARDAGDDRAYLQALIDATPDGSDLTIPPGRYVVARAGTTDYALRISRPIVLRGPDVTLVQAPATAASVRLLHVDSPDVTLDRLTFDGADVDQVDHDEHRAGVFVTRERVRLRDVTAQHFTGDGVYLYGNPTTHLGASDAVIEGVMLVDNQRNGVTIGGLVAGVAIRGGIFARNGAQQIDSEPGAPYTVDNVTIADALIDPGASAEYAVTVSGSGSGSRSAHWRLTGNTITRGGIFVVWAEDVVIAGNTIASSSAKPCVYVYRTALQVTIAHNACAMTSPDASFPGGIAVIGTGTGQAADGITIVDNDVTLAAPTGLGVRVQGALAATIVGNRLHGSGVVNLGGSAIYVRPTDQTTPMREAIVVGNSGSRFGKRGLSLAGNVTARLLQLTAVANTFGDAGAVQDVGIYLDDGTHPVVRSTLVEQHYGAGVTSGRLGEALP